MRLGTNVVGSDVQLLLCSTVLPFFKKQQITTQNRLDYIQRIVTD